MSMVIEKDQIERVECRFAVYCEPPNPRGSDMHFVKGTIHLKDGTKVPHTWRVKDFKRPFWITREGFRNHKDKKEWEHLKKVQKFETTQSRLMESIAHAIGKPNFRGTMKNLCRDPYIYGADILSTAVLKRSYMDKYPGDMTPFTVAVFDTETDVLHGTEKVIMGTLSFGKTVFTAIDKSYFDGYSDVIPRLQQAMNKYLGEVVARRGIKWEVVIVDSEVDIILQCLNKAHELKPDFLAIWNINFDIPKMVTALQNAGIDPKDAFSDPSVPREYRHFYYKQGPKQKVTASGRVIPIKPAAQWHTVFTPASFYVIDAMCAYRHIRTGEPEEPSYGLDAILKKHKLGGKLKFAEADHVGGLKWHQLMQSAFKFEYVVYNVWDCVSMEELDEVTKDLRLSLPMMSGCSDFENFKSQPRRVVDELHFFVQNQNPPRVMGTTSDEMSGEFDEQTIGLKDWIVMLPAHLVANNGLKIIEEYPELRTNIRRGVGDLDVAASYPNGECVFNVSKETTAKELLSIEGVDEYTQRMQGINLCGSHTNAVEFCCNIFKLPTLTEMHLAFEEEMKAGIHQVFDPTPEVQPEQEYIAEF